MFLRHLCVPSDNIKVLVSTQEYAVSTVRSTVRNLLLRFLACWTLSEVRSDPRSDRIVLARRGLNLTPQPWAWVIEDE